MKLDELGEVFHFNYGTMLVIFLIVNSLSLSSPFTRHSLAIHPPSIFPSKYSQFSIKHDESPLMFPALALKLLWFFSFLSSSPFSLPVALFISVAGIHPLPFIAVLFDLEKKQLITSQATHLTSSLSTLVSPTVGLSSYTFFIL